MTEKSSLIYKGNLNKFNKETYNEDLFFIPDLKTIVFNGDFYGKSLLDSDVSLDDFKSNGEYFLIGSDVENYLSNSTFSSVINKYNLTFAENDYLVLNIIVNPLNNDVVNQQMYFYESSNNKLYNFIRTFDKYNIWSDWTNANNNSNNNTSDTIDVEWTPTSNMNNYITKGVYNIYGERTNASDNIPITQAFSGATIAAKLTVIDGSLKPADGSEPTEISVTQFLQLSNRVGGDGNSYFRTYNQNNGKVKDGSGTWTYWQKVQGIKEGYIFTNDTQVNIDGGVQTIAGVTGIDNMIDNGLYSGVYTDDYTFQKPTILETFVLIVINDYAISGKLGSTKIISQLKYAIDRIKGCPTIYKRFKYDGEEWSDWENVVSVDINTKIENHDVNFTSSVIKPNVLHVWGTLADSATFNITLSTDVSESDVNEYMLQFSTGNVAPTLGFPSDIKWLAVPNVQANKTYQISIINNLGVIGEFGNE